MAKDIEEIGYEELLLLCAEDSDFYCHHWFPNTFTSSSPYFHDEMWKLLDDHSKRYVAFKVFRGGAKTTVTRAYTTKRIAYAISRTILILSETQDHSIRSLRWIKKQVEFNTRWTEFYGLKKGSKWTDEWIEIEHLVEGITINILAVGITGQIRGINLDDHRPDFIIADDPCNEENTATPAQRKKISDLFFGAMSKSLVPPTASPSAKIALLQTPFNSADLIETCMKDPSWSTYSCGCFFEGTSDSAWEQVFPTDYLRQEKKDHTRRNQLSLWLREMEVKVVSEETSVFLGGWLKVYAWGDWPDQMRTFMAIDPLPPPTELAIQQGLHNKDFEAFAVVGRQPGVRKIHLLETRYKRGHYPDWTLKSFWELVDRWQPVRIRVEPVAYQATLKWLLEQSMLHKRRFVHIVEQSTWRSGNKVDRRKKLYRISDALTNVCSNGQFYYCPEVHEEFASQFITYPNAAGNDDVLEAVAEATSLALEEQSFDDGLNEEEELEPQVGEYIPKLVAKSYGGWAP